MKSITLVAVVFFINVRCVHSVPTGADFLKIGVGGRAAGMGEAFTAAAGGANSACWNPAGILGVKTSEFSFMHNEPMPDLTLGFAGYARSAGDRGALAVSSVFYIADPIPVTDITGIIGEATWTDWLVSFSYARGLSGSLSCGASLKRIQRSESDPLAGNTEGTAYAADLGAIYRTPVKGLSAGAALLHNGTRVQMAGETKIDDLPRAARLGILYEWSADAEHRFVFTCDASKVLDGSWRGSAGAEFSFKDSFFVRTGYFDKDGNISGLTYGFGAVFGEFSVDYSNVPAGQMLGNTRSNKVSLNLTFK